MASRPGRWERVFAAMLAGCGGLMVVVAATLDPYDASGRPRTRGTHLQLGLPPCTMLAISGFPCPTCGMTTATSLLFHGDPLAAWHANSAGVVVAIAGLLASGWLGCLAAGVHRKPLFSVDKVVLAMAVVGAAAAVVRYVWMLGAELIAPIG